MKAPDPPVQQDGIRCRCFHFVMNPSIPLMLDLPTQIQLPLVNFFYSPTKDYREFEPTSRRTTNDLLNGIQ